LVVRKESEKEKKSVGMRHGGSVNSFWQNILKRMRAVRIIKLDGMQSGDK